MDTEVGDDDQQMPAFRETPLNVDPLESSPSLFDKDESPESSDRTEPVITFGDDLDVPAFIRNRRE